MYISLSYNLEKVKHILSFFTHVRFVPSLVENWPCCSRYVVNVFSLLSPRGKGRDPIHPGSDALCQVWLKLVKWFWRKWTCEKFRDRRIDGRTTGFQKFWSSSDLKKKIAPLSLSRRGSRNFSKVEEETFERKMFVDTRINACTHKI